MEGDSRELHPVHRRVSGGRNVPVGGPGKLGEIGEEQEPGVGVRRSEGGVGHKRTIES